MAVAMLRPVIAKQDFTYRDYVALPEDGTRWEIIDGELYMMAAPHPAHQWIQTELSNRLYNFLKNRRCRVFTAPFDVAFAFKKEKTDDIKNVVQPDIIVFCGSPKSKDLGGRRIPDIAIEILSPSSGNIDRIKKFQLYQQAGIKEYWLVDGAIESIEVYSHDGKAFIRHGSYSATDTVTSAVLEGFEFAASEVFPTEEEHEYLEWLKVDRSQI